MSELVQRPRLEALLDRLPGLRSTTTRIVLTFLVMVALFALITLVSESYETTRTSMAEDFFKRGNALAAKGLHREAIERYQDALSISRSDARFQLALATELAKAGRFAEAAVYLQQVLEEDPTHGPANLWLARISAGEGKTEFSISYYRRAFYGWWPANPEQNRLAAGFELVHLLGEQDRRKQAIALLLEMAEMAPADTAVRKRVAYMLLEFGSPNQAAEMFTEIVATNRRDAEAFAGFGRAQIALGDNRQARTALRTALRLNPADEKVRSDLAMVEQVLELDPMQPRLRVAERYARSRALVQTTLESLGKCEADLGAILPEQVQTDAQTARKVLARKTRPPRIEEAMNSNLALAQNLWAARQKLCPPEYGSAVAKVMEGLAP